MGIPVLPLELRSRYELIRALGTGGFGHTYLARHILMDELVCLKFIREPNAEKKALLRKEAKILRKIVNHGFPAVCDLVDAGDAGYILVMNYIEGPTSLEVLLDLQSKGFKSLAPESVVWILDRLLNLLTFLRYHGVVHGDIKPQNIIVREQEHMVYLVDFGFAELKPTSSSQFQGFTRVFSPPEQVERTRPPSPFSDIYSLGMVALYLLSGDLQATEQKRIPSHVPEPFQVLVYDMVEREIMRRASLSSESNFRARFNTMREQVFGRRHSGLQPIAGYKPAGGR